MTASYTPEQEQAALAALVSRMRDPQVANSLANLLDHADLLALLVEALDGFVARSEVIGDNLVGGLTELREAGGGRSEVDLPGLVQSGVSLASVVPKAVPGLVEAVESGAIDKLLAAGVVSAEALPQVELLARGLARGSRQYADAPMQVGGLMSLPKLLKDPDIARALSYFATVAKAVGQEIAQQPPSPAAEPGAADQG